MNWRRAAYAASAGLVTAFIIIGTFIAGIYSFGVDLIGGSVPPTLSERLWGLIGVPTIASLGAVLPLRILGVRWRRCLIIAFTAHFSAFVIVKILQVVITVIYLLFFDFWVILSVVIAILLTIIEIKAVNARRAIIILAITTVLAFLPIIIDLLFISAMLAWIILPAIAALFSHQDSEK
jgi:hypothetical protein